MVGLRYWMSANDGANSEAVSALPANEALADLARCRHGHDQAERVPVLGIVIYVKSKNHKFLIQCLVYLRTNSKPRMVSTTLLVQFLVSACFR